MKVLVCDDDDKFLKIIREYLQQIGSEQNLQLEILGIQNPDELMEQVKKNPDIQLIFLDIIFEGSENNGIKIEEEIQKVNNSIPIVFITNYDSFAVQSYQVNAIGYLLKPVTYEEFQTQFQKCLSKIKEEEKCLCIKTECNHAVIKYSDLMYIDTMDRSIWLHTIYQKYKVRYTMKELENILKTDARFFRIHTAYIVNIQYIVSISGSEVILKNGESILISKYKKKKFMQAILEYSKSSRWL